jgi:hypothetical protein
MNLVLEVEVPVDDRGERISDFGGLRWVLHFTEQRFIIWTEFRDVITKLIDPWNSQGTRFGFVIQGDQDQV